MLRQDREGVDLRVAITEGVGVVWAVLEMDDGVPGRFRAGLSEEQERRVVREPGVVERTPPLPGGILIGDEGVGADRGVVAMQGQPELPDVVEPIWPDGADAERDRGAGCQAPTRSGSPERSGSSS